MEDYDSSASASSRSSASSTTCTPRKKKSPTRRKKKSRVQKLSEEQLLLALEKKKECDKKAQIIVEKLLETIVDADILKDMLKDINQTHMDDIIEERAILKQCGYPLCKAVLTYVPNKQYQISTRSNTVFDITDRKKFCSNKCFKAANYIKEQMLTSPLWLRDQVEIPEFKLLSLS